MVKRHKKIQLWGTKILKQKKNSQKNKPGDILDSLCYSILCNGLWAATTASAIVQQRLHTQPEQGFSSPVSLKNERRWIFQGGQKLHVSKRIADPLHSSTLFHTLLPREKGPALKAKSTCRRVMILVKNSGTNQNCPNWTMQVEEEEYNNTQMIDKIQSFRTDPPGRPCYKLSATIRIPSDQVKKNHHGQDSPWLTSNWYLEPASMYGGCIKEGGEKKRKTTALFTYKTNTEIWQFE